MFTQRHFKAIARIIRETEMDGVSRGMLIERFATEFASDNPRFKREMFVKACTPEPKPILP